MFRYLGFAWDPLCAQHAKAASLICQRITALSSAWSEVFTSNGLRVFCADSRTDSLEARQLSGNKGVVLGAIFRNRDNIEEDTPSSSARLDDTQSKSIHESRGRWLIDHCWGNYVALLFDSTTGSTWLTKDPTGSLPCFITSSHGVAVIFSSIVDCVALGLSFTANRSYLRTRLLGSGGNFEQKSLCEVDQVHRGECIELDPRLDQPVTSRRLHWNPLNFSETCDPIEDSKRASRAMRAVVRSCTHTWASCHDSLIIRLSGGLDSSIIMGCLRDVQTQPRMVCYTYYNPRGRSDERPWARLVAQHAAVERLEYAISPADIDLRLILKMEASVEPIAAMGYIQIVSIEKELAAARGASAIFTGDGGDSGFGSDSIALALPDYFCRHGFGPDTFRLASRVALYTDQSTWMLLLRSLRLWISGSRMSHQRQAMLMSSQLVNPDLRHEMTFAKRYPHIWFNHRKRIPWSTIRRVGMLVCTPDSYGGAESSGSTPDMVSPLYSQPVIELLLRIPTYMHFADGRDRGLARLAFEQDVPQPILQRRWKDRAPGFYDELLYRNRALLRELLLEGILVREKLLNKAALEEALSGAPSKSAVLPGEVFRHLDLEIWARRWLRE